MEPKVKYLVTLRTELREMTDQIDEYEREMLGKDDNGTVKALKEKRDRADDILTKAESSDKIDWMEISKELGKEFGDLRNTLNNLTRKRTPGPIEL